MTDACSSNILTYATDTLSEVYTVLGADVNKATTNNDHTVLSLACAGGHVAVVELLLKSGANASHKLKVFIPC
jgi:ankyrin repeat protein